MVFADNGRLAVKLRAFLDFAGPELRSRLASLAETRGWPARHAHGHGRSP